MDIYREIGDEYMLDNPYYYVEDLQNILFVL